jgi:hypothetical protein
MKRLYPLDKAMTVYHCFLRMMWKMEERDPVCESVPLGIPVYRQRARPVRVRATTNTRFSTYQSIVKELIE